jgi:hypothetical protein
MMTMLSHDIPSLSSQKPAIPFAAVKVVDTFNAHHNPSKHRFHGLAVGTAGLG